MRSVPMLLGRRQQLDHQYMLLSLGQQIQKDNISLCGLNASQAPMGPVSRYRHKWTQVLTM